jgi:hypothetical protein
VTEAFPLAIASERMRSAGGRFPGRPGRPREPGKQDSGQNSVEPKREVRDQGTEVRRGAGLEVILAPRLLSLEAAAAYLAVSPWTVRDLDAAGVLKRVRVPLPNGGELRKVLYDREDLDRAVDQWKA